MTRYQFAVTDDFDKRKAQIERFLQEKLDFLPSEDDFLRYTEKHFFPLEDRTVNGYKNQGSIRYKKGHFRLPSSKRLAVYETEEFNQRKKPRGIVTIDYFVVCYLFELNDEELRKDGYVSHDDMLLDMVRYYPKLNTFSVVSFYDFKEYEPRHRIKT